MDNLKVRGIPHSVMAPLAVSGEYPFPYFQDLPIASYVHSSRIIVPSSVFQEPKLHFDFCARI